MKKDFNSTDYKRFRAVTDVMPIPRKDIAYEFSSATNMQESPTSTQMAPATTSSTTSQPATTRTNTSSTPLSTTGSTGSSTRNSSTGVPPPPKDTPLRQEVTLSSYLLIFAFAIIVVEAVIIKISEIPSEGAIRLLTVTLILISALFLTTAGYGNEQIAAATGLLGTIAGYLLGRSNSNSNDGRPSQPAQPTQH
jgi:hypothetical protein